MKCIICHGDNIIKKETYEEVKRGNNIVFIPIKVPVCCNCGEKYYDRRTMQKLEKFEEQEISDNFNYSEIGKVLKLETVI